MLTKADVIEKINEDSNISKKAIAEVLDSFVGVLRGAMEKGETVQFRGFATFSTRVRKAYTGSNPRTGEKITIPEHKRINVKISKAFTDNL